MHRERALKVVLVLLGLLFLRCRLSACADGEARPCSGDDDESLRDTRRLLAARFPQPLSASQPDRLHRVVELCTRDCHGGSGIPKFHRSPRTARSGYLHCDRRSTDRSSSGKTDETADREGIGSRIGWSVAPPASYPALRPALIRASRVLPSTPRGAIVEHGGT
jgi:hypothetical protein